MKHTLKCQGLTKVYKKNTVVNNIDLELESGIVINPVLENEAHYRYWLGALPFYDNVEKEGIVIG